MSDRLVLPFTLGKYVLKRNIGSGPTGTVYQAIDTSSYLIVAFKIPHQPLADCPAIRGRWKREARVAHTVIQPNIARVVELGNSQGIDFLARVFVEGKPLTEFATL